VGGIISATIYLFFFRNRPFPPSLDNLFTSVISISAIAVGFFATAKTILFSIGQSNIIIQLKNAKVFDLLVNYIMSAINYCLVLAILTGFWFFFDLETPEKWYPWAFGAWLFFVSLALLSSYRVIRILAKILKSI
jgi:hypothetical protein